MNSELIIKEIIKEQSQIIGEGLAKSRALASGVVGFKSTKIDDIYITSQDPSSSVQKIVDSFAKVFGNASIGVCNEVVKRYQNIL